MSTENEYVNEACKAFYTLSSDEYFRKLCYDRENYYADLRGAQELIAEKEEMIKEKDSVISQQHDAIKEKDSVISQQDEALKEQNYVISQQDKTIHEMDSEIARLRQQLLDAGLDPNS